LSERPKICGWKWGEIRFWEDVWLRECPLKIRFNKLYEISREQRWVVARVLEGVRLTYLSEEGWGT
jgi:hypothetical protein